MSQQARRNFKKSTARLAVVVDTEERRLLSGPAKHRVTGAGKHLRVIDPRPAAKTWLRKAQLRIGLPGNLVWPKDATVNDLRRYAGWINACPDHKPAMVVLGCLFDLGSNKGTESPRHLGGHRTMPWLMRLWASPNLITGQQASALRWLVKASRHSDWEGGHVTLVIERIRNVKLLDQLHRLSPLARWAIAHTLPTVGDLTHRDLDWEFLAALKRKDMLQYVPYKLRLVAQWRDLGIQTPKEVSCSPRGVAVGTMRAVETWVKEAAKGFYSKEATKDLFSKPENFDAALRLALLFGRDQIGCIRYLHAYMEYRSMDVHNNRTLAMHDAAQKLPAVKVSPGWKAFVVNNLTSPYYSQVMDNLQKVEEVCGGVPGSVGEARHKFMLAGVPWSFDLNSMETRFVAEHPSKLFEMCPDVLVRDGEYTLKKLESWDTRQLTAGRLTDCCQHLDGAGADCAALAWTSGACAIYAAFKGERMVAQTFAWRAKDGSLVFDSIEALGGVNREVVLPMFSRAAEQIIDKLGVVRVLCGVTNYGITTSFNSLYSKGSVRTPESVVALGYSDAKSGCKVVCEGITMPPIPGEEEEDLSPDYVAAAAARPNDATNTLMEGSDVFCEHCGAEVHPACEICPSCERDISDWVE